mgnify:CR=1 FL=1
MIYKSEATNTSKFIVYFATGIYDQLIFLQNTEEFQVWVEKREEGNMSMTDCSDEAKKPGAQTQYS